MDIEPILKIVKLVCNTDNISAETDLFSEGYIDSLGLVNLLIELETQLGVYIAITSIERDKAFTPLTILELIK